MCDDGDEVEVVFKSCLPSIPIPFAIWEKLGGRGTWEWMKEQGIVAHVSKPDQARHRCREFTLAEHVIEGFLRAGLEDHYSRVLNLFTGKPVSRVRRSPATDPSRHPWFPKESAGAMAFEVLSESRCYINYAAMRKEVAFLRSQADRWKSPRARMRAMCAEAALLSIRIYGDLRREQLIGTGICSYQPAYRPSYPGRLHEIGLGVQGCPRSVKAAAFSFPGVINYDLSAALAASLLAAVDDYNASIAAAMAGGKFKAGDIPAAIDDRWLRRYINDPTRGSAWLAERIRVPREVAKEIFYALMFGGSVKRAVKDILTEHFEGDECLAKSVLRRVRLILCWRQRDGSASLVQMLEQVDEVIYLHVTRSDIFRSPKIVRMISALRINRTRHGTSAVNAVGRSLCVLDHQGVRAMRDDGERLGERHLRCHLTQGIEQQFIAMVVVEMIKEPGGPSWFHQNHVATTRRLRRLVFPDSATCRRGGPTMCGTGTSVRRPRGVCEAGVQADWLASGARRHMESR